jgi:membrane-associated phospholipid phosphatase
MLSILEQSSSSMTVLELDNLLKGKCRRIFLLAASISVVIVLLALLPHVDLAVASWFYHGGHFIADGYAASIARDVAGFVPFATLAILSLFYFGSKHGWVDPRLAPSARSMVFLLSTLALAPGLVVNVALKDHIHRPRPVQIRQFGGSFDFQPYDRLSGACPRNCSFPSGEAAAAFWTLAPASLAPQPWRPVLVVAALLFGSATGLLRMATGHHFLSDIVFAALITLAFIAAVRRFLWPPDG